MTEQIKRGDEVDLGSGTVQVVGFDRRIVSATPDGFEEKEIVKLKTNPESQLTTDRDLEEVELSEFWDSIVQR